MHILEVNEKEDKARVAMHFSVPTGQNQAGIDWSTVIQSVVEDTTSVVPTIQTAEQTELTNGTKIEIVKTIEFDAHATDAEKIAVIDAAYTAEETIQTALISKKYKYWGMERTVS